MATDSERLDEDIRELRRKQEEQRNEIMHLRELIGNLTAIQKNTTDNINVLTSDVKEMLKHSLTYEMLEKEIVMINRRVDELDNNKAWLMKLIIGAIVMALIGLVIDVKAYKYAGAAK